MVMVMVMVIVVVILLNHQSINKRSVLLNTKCLREYISYLLCGGNPLQLNSTIHDLICYESILDINMFRTFTLDAIPAQLLCRLVITVKYWWWWWWWC